MLRMTWWMMRCVQLASGAQVHRIRCLRELEAFMPEPALLQLPGWTACRDRLSRPLVTHKSRLHPGSLAGMAGALFALELFSPWTCQCVPDQIDSSWSMLTLFQQHFIS